MNDNERAQSGQAQRRPHVILPDGGPASGERQSPSWASVMPEPPGLPPSAGAPVDDPGGPSVTAAWLRGLAASVGLGLLGAVFYVSLAVLVGAQIFPAVIVIGILCGAGLRVGGIAPGWPAGAVAAVSATVFLWAGAALARACADAMQSDGDLGAAISPYVTDPVTASARLFEETAFAVVLVVLTCAGAVLATQAYRPRGA